MHKITKGLKKKKKGKKSKRKEEELFKPEELENYRKEHQGTSEETTGQNEEWKKFLALTSGVDDVVKKSQGDLDRIRSTSFFQRKPTESEVRKSEEIKVSQERERIKERELEEEVQQKNTASLGIVEVSESESEEDEDDNIFDTAYIDAIATGEVKLAYIPESPTDKQEGDDPFDTSIAERAILGPEVNRKGKKLVPIGAAVEVLTGRVQLPTCARNRPINRRQVIKEQDLLLDSFDDLSSSVRDSAPAEEPKKTLLDEDPIPLPDEPITNLIQPPAQVVNTVGESTDKRKDIISEFDTITNFVEDDDDKEFEALAAESLSKSVNVVQALPVDNASDLTTNLEWNAFDDVKIQNKNEEINDDPFDTTFVETVLPGKAELKIIAKEFLDDEIKEENKFITKKSVNVKFIESVANTVNQSENRFSENELNAIKPIHRDLLGGSNTDLSIISKPLQPFEKVDPNYVEYCDPFDTSIVDAAKEPGQAELKLLEKELLGKGSDSDDDFDPRAEEETPRERTISRPDVLIISAFKTVSFDVPSPIKTDLLGTEESGPSKVVKPLTPFYIRKNSVPELPLREDTSDPFDTTFALNIAPGKAELKIIESELFDPNIEKNLSLVDSNFDPRDDKKAEIDKVLNTIKDISIVKSQSITTIDLLTNDNDLSAKVLTPGGDEGQTSRSILYSDPFDTSIASNIQPGKTELKLLETEFIHSNNVIAHTNKDLTFKQGVLTFSESVSVESLLERRNEIIVKKPLSPSEASQSFSSFVDKEDFDPFDTSIANNIEPGKAELKLIESELIN